MMALHARVKSGRLELNEPTNLSEGERVELMPDDDADDEAQAALHAALDEGLADLRAGRTVPAETVIAQLLAR